MMYVGDRYGFHNENYVYNQNIIDIVMTGDSFTEGWSVKSEENIGAVLQKFGFKVVNIGKAGNGSLIELAAIKEYAEQLKPKIVLWIYFINDLIDLSYEIKSLILNKYLNDDGFSQNLISRQNEIDSVLINHVQFEWNKERERKRENESWINNWVIRILKLWNLRVRINLIPIPTTTSYPTSYPTYSTRPVFIDILKRSKQMVSRWGGEMYFVYLPDIYRYSTGNENPNREFVLQTVTELGIPIIDIHREVFNIHPDPMSLFPFRLNSHYNAEGYKLVAEAIGKRLEADGISPSNDNN
jgi:hypothetical protein